jgi:hypothetical protein
LIHFRFNNDSNSNGFASRRMPARHSSLMHKLLLALALCVLPTCVWGGNATIGWGVANGAVDVRRQLDSHALEPWLQNLRVESRQGINGQTISWFLNRTAGSVTFEVLSPNAITWLGLGLSRQGLMIAPPSVAVVGSTFGVYQVALTLMDISGILPLSTESLVRLPGEQRPSWPPTVSPIPPPNAAFVPLKEMINRGTQPLKPAWGVLPDGRGCYLRFTRSLLSSGSQHDVDIDPDALTWVIFSHGDSISPGYHGPTNRGRMLVSLSSQCSGTEASGSWFSGGSGQFTRLMHGLTMFFGWGLASLSGVFVARYCRHKRWWIETHVKLQSAASVGAVSALILAVGIVQSQLAHWHAILGATVMTLTIAQVGMGAFIHAQRMQRLGAEGGAHRTELWVAMGHRTLGRCLVLSAVVNAFEGLRLLGALPGFTVALAVFVSLAGGVFLVFEVRLQRRRCIPAEKQRQQRQIMLGLAMVAAKAVGHRRIRSVQATVSHKGGTPLDDARERLRSAVGVHMLEVEEPVVEQQEAIADLLHTAHSTMRRPLVEQLQTLMVWLSMIDVAHCTTLSCHPADRAEIDVIRAATAVAAFPMFAGSREAIASLHKDKLREMETVERIAVASEALRLAGETKGERLVETWWRPSTKLVDLVSTATMLVVGDALPSAESDTERLELFQGIPPGFSLPSSLPRLRWGFPTASLGQSLSVAIDPATYCHALHSELADSAVLCVCPFLVLSGSVTIGLLHKSVGGRRESVARVTVDAGQMWAYQRPFAHKVVACSSDAQVLAFEPEAWWRYSDAGVLAVPFATRVAAPGAIQSKVLRGAPTTQQHCAMM